MGKNQVKIMDAYDITLATRKDEEQVLSLLKEVAGWLKDKEIDQWRFLADGGEDEEIKQAILSKSTYVVKKSESFVATFTLYETQSDWDQHIWGQKNDGAVYLHRLALTREAIGSALGKTVLLWLEEHVKEMGKTILRLDCVENNSKLNYFYLNNGYENVGVKDEHSKYQKNL
ncbi:GNAT family N-acetyltransferase [Bacillus spongiae]|uniref:GNAT family N-acetyltransferase n=1 Tax=Bacillus spongiae TaxID=2683610 RepID=A0ABU8HCX6_9BACI